MHSKGPESLNDCKPEKGKKWTKDAKKRADLPVPISCPSGTGPEPVAFPNIFRM